MGDLVEGLGVRYAIIRPTLVFGAGREVVPRQRLSLDYNADVNTNMVKPILSIAILIATCLACSGGGDVVKIGTEGEYPPYNFINDSGEVDGFERELGDELCRRADLECVWVTNEWDSIILNLVEGKYDTIMAGMSITDERDEVIDFTQSYFPPSPSAYIARAGAGDEVVTGKVAAQVATIHASYLSQSAAMLLEYATVPELISAVLSGEADAALVDLRFALDSMAESGEWLALVGPELMLSLGVGIGIREGDNELKNKLDRAIAAMKKDGSLNALIKKWFGPDAKTF